MGGHIYTKIIAKDLSLIVRINFSLILQTVCFLNISIWCRNISQAVACYIIHVHGSCLRAFETETESRLERSMTFSIKNFLFPFLSDSYYAILLESGTWILSLFFLAFRFPRLFILICHIQFTLKFVSEGLWIRNSKYLKGTKR